MSESGLLQSPHPWGCRGQGATPAPPLQLVTTAPDSLRFLEIYLYCHFITLALPPTGDRRSLFCGVAQGQNHCLKIGFLPRPPLPSQFYN